MKIILYILLLLVAAFLLYVLGLFIFSLTVDQTKPIEKQNKFCLRAINFLVPIFNFICGVRLKTSGLEKLPKDERFVIVCNHRSMFDPLTAIQALRDFNVSFVSKPENLKLPLVGGIVYAAGYLPIDRHNDRQALKDLLQAADYVKNDFCSMGIYPEGTRGDGTELLPFHAGSFKLPQRAGVGLAIAATDGTELVKKNLILHKTNVTYDVLEFIPAEKVKEMKASELAEYSQKLISGHLRGKQ